MSELKENVAADITKREKELILWDEQHDAPPLEVVEINDTAKGRRFVFRIDDQRIVLKEHQAAFLAGWLKGKILHEQKLSPVQVETLTNELEAMAVEIEPDIDEHHHDRRGITRVP